MVRGHGGDIKYSYTIINAIAAKLPEQAIENIQKNPRVTYVEMDVEVHTLEDTLPWGVDRIDAELVWNGAEDGCDVIGGRNY
jgi:subtilisin